MSQIGIGEDIGDQSRQGRLVLGHGGITFRVLGGTTGLPRWPTCVNDDEDPQEAAQVNFGPSALVLFDVTTLHFRTHEGERLPESRFSKERRIEPQITVGLLTVGSGLPLMINAFEGNRAETARMLPTIHAFMEAHDARMW